MRMKTSPQGAITFTKVTVAAGGIWPPSANATRLETILYEVYWWLALAVILLIETFVLYKVAMFDNDSSTVTRSVTTITGMMQVAIKMTICRAQRARFQMLISEMESFVRSANPRERGILQRYVDRCASFHVFATVWFYVIFVCLITGPLYLPEPFPVPAEYPFDALAHPTYELLYFHQAAAEFLTLSNAAADCQMGLLIWYTTARFEMLAMDLRESKSLKQIRACIVTHLELLGYAGELVRAVRFGALLSLSITSFAVIFSGIQLVIPQPVMIKLQYGIVVIGACMQFFIYVWPADTLAEMSTYVGTSAYESSWIGKQGVTRNMLFLLLRSNKPVVIRVSGLLPELSLLYYGKFLSTTFSYFTTLRLILDEGEAA